MLPGTRVFCFGWFALIATLFEEMQLEGTKKSDGRENVANGPLVPLPLDPVHKYNELIPFYAVFNGTVTLVNDFRTGPDVRRRRRHGKDVYSEWSEWTACSEKCTTTRQRHCVRPNICGLNTITESFHCFTADGSAGCPVLVIDSNYGRTPTAGHQSPPEKDDANFTCGVTAHDTAAGPSYQSPRYSMKIMGGRESDRFRWPWQVAVLSGSKELICGGTLIAPGWVLTAAHCSRRKLYGRLMEHNLFADEGDEFDVRVDRVIVHPRYNPNTIDNDVALLKLRAFDLETYGAGGRRRRRRHLQPACLPVSGFQRRKRKPTKCVVIGWGKVRSRDPYGSPTLREATVPIVGQRQCRAAYRRYMITDNMFCAGYKDGRSDTCSGDSGGPLLCRMRGRWTVVGVTSFGDGCGRRGKYGIYASVANHVRWIAAAVATADPSG